MAAATQVPVVADLSVSGSSDFLLESVLPDPVKLAAQVSSRDPVFLIGKVAVLPRQEWDQEIPPSNVRVEILDVSQAPNPRPAKILFGGLQDPDVQVVRPIPLDVCVEESAVVVSWAEIDEFGTGENLSCALDDLSHTLRELYHYLHAADTTPGVDLLRVKNVLEEYIEPRTK